MKPESQSTACVHLVDDDDSLRTALERLLRAAGHEVRGYGSVADFLLAGESRLEGCLLLDVRMPGGPSGLELHQALLRRGETLPVIFLTGHGDIPMGVRAIKDGAFDFLTKPVKSEDLLRAVGQALESSRTLRARRSEQDRIRKLHDSLTLAEKVVCGKVVAGLPNKQIADEIGCSERTVKAHRSQVMLKMGASSLPDLVRLVQGLI